MATTAVTVYWPRDATVQRQQHDATQYTLMGFRVDERTACVVELVPVGKHDSDIDDRVESDGVEAIGIAMVVSAEQHEALMLNQKEPADGATKKQLFLRVHLVTHNSSRQGRLVNLITSFTNSTMKQSTPAVVYVESCGAANTEDSSAQCDDIRHCNLVFYDAQLAMKGCLARCGCTLSEKSAFHAPLIQIDRVFVNRVERQRALQGQGVRATGLCGLAEAIGYYLIFAPSLVILRVAAVLNDFVTAPVSAISGKCAKDGSRFLEVLCYHLHSLARVPGVVRNYHLMSKNRRTSDDEVSDALEAWNYGWYVVMDAAVGRLLAGFVFQILIAQFQARELSPAAFLEILRSNVVWLMGAPAGFKLNAPLASILGNGILLWFDLWEYALSLLIGSDAPWTRLLLQSSWACEALNFVWRNMGATLQLTLLADALTFFTWNSYWVYQYFTKLNMLQFGLFSSLWKLFLGKKNNVLRKRVDSCEYDVSQLLLGTLLFTILFFIVTTNMVFFVYFGLVRLVIFAMQAALWLPVVCLRAVPVASLVYRWWHPTFFVAGVRLETSRNPLARSTNTLDVHDVGVGKQRPSDVQAQQLIREVAARDWSVPARVEGTRIAYFQVAPIASSASSLFSRLRQYSKALSTHYALGAVVRSWFFGSHISPVPLTLLFESLLVLKSDRVNTQDEEISAAAASPMVSPVSKKNV